MLPRIESIVEIGNFRVVANWNTGETRSIDFAPILEPFKSKPHSSIGQLLDPAVFAQVRVDHESKTLSWDGLLTLRNADGTTNPAPLDFCPDVLFEISTPVKYQI